MTKRPVLVLGGSSDIGLAIARRFAKEGYPIQLGVRRPDEMQSEATDISLRNNVEVTLHRFDALEIDQIESFYNGLVSLPTIVVCAVGLLGDQNEAESNPFAAKLIVESNFIGPTIALEAAARRLAALDEPTTIIGISSVAGDRGRAKNYWYGASKSAFAATLSGLRQKYSGTNLAVLTLKPGFVQTKMTRHLDMPTALTDIPGQVAQNAFIAARKKKLISYTSWRWKLLMLLITSLPERYFQHRKF